MTFAQWMDVLLSDQNPLLPSTVAMHVYLRAAWLALMLVGAMWLLRMVAARTRVVASMLARIALSVLLVIWILLPAGLSPAYWLALAFSAPALLSVLLCIGLEWKYNAVAQNDSAAASRWGKAYAVLGVVAGYALLLDTLALLPVQLYAWGFSPAALACALAVAAVPCVALNPWQPGNRWTLRMPVALLLFVLTRLPTGNVWDVLLDPLLWVALHVYLLVTVRLRVREQPATPA